MSGKEIKTRFSSRTRGIEPEPGEVGAQTRKRSRPQDVALPTIETESFSEEEDLNTPTTPNESSETTMATNAELAAALKLLTDRMTQLESSNKISDRETRSVTPAHSAFGGTDFQPTGFAALPAFKPYGKDQRAANPAYDSKAKKAGIDPGKFRGDKLEFDEWIIKVADKLEEDDTTFRRERTRMALVNSWVEGNAHDLIEARYRSTENPFLSVSEMVATLTAVYHDDNQSTKARDALKSLKYEPGNKTMDIHQFIGKVNSLADKANVAKSERKTLLYEHIPAHLDPRLLGDSKDPSVSYETFANRVVDAALANDRSWKERREHREKRQRENPTSNQPVKKTFVKTENQSPKPEGSYKDVECFLCKTKGHIAKRCPDKTKLVAALLLDDSEGDDTDETTSQSTQSSRSENE